MCATRKLVLCMLTRRNKNQMTNEIINAEDGEINIQEQNGQMVVCSVEVAEHYEKRHDNLMQAINKLMSTNNKCKEMFMPGTYSNARNHEYPCYFMTRDGLSILTMGFTGVKAVEWKVKYINAFNAMEKTIQLAKMDSYRIEDPVLRAKRWIEEKKAALAVEEKLKIAAPKAETFDHICTSQASSSFTEAAKVLGVKRRDLIEQLERHFYLYRNNRNLLVPYSRYAEAGSGYFILRRVPCGTPWRNQHGEICQNTNPQTFITMNGMDAMRRLMKKWHVKKTA